MSEDKSREQEGKETIARKQGAHKLEYTVEDHQQKVFWMIGLHVKLN